MKKTALLSAFLLALYGFLLPAALLFVSTAIGRIRLPPDLSARALVLSKPSAGLALFHGVPLLLIGAVFGGMMLSPAVRGPRRLLRALVGAVLGFGAFFPADILLWFAGVTIIFNERLAASPSPCGLPMAAFILFTPFIFAIPILGFGFGYFLTWIVQKTAETINSPR